MRSGGADEQPELPEMTGPDRQRQRDQPASACAIPPEPGDRRGPALAGLADPLADPMRQPGDQVDGGRPRREDDHQQRKHDRNGRQRDAEQRLAQRPDPDQRRHAPDQQRGQVEQLFDHHHRQGEPPVKAMAPGQHPGLGDIAHLRRQDQVEGRGGQDQPSGRGQADRGPHQQSEAPGARQSQRHGGGKAERQPGGLRRREPPRGSLAGRSATTAR